MESISPYHEELDWLLEQLRRAQAEERPHWRDMIDKLTAAKLEEQKGKNATWGEMPKYVQDHLAHDVLCLLRAKINNEQA